MGIKAKLLSLVTKAKPLAITGAKAVAGWQATALEFGIWLVKFAMERIWPKPKAEAKADESPKPEDRPGNQ